MTATLPRPRATLAAGTTARARRVRASADVRVLGALAVLVGVVALIVIAWAVFRIVRRRMAWPVPLVGITAIVAVYFACRLLVDAAVTRGV